MPNKQYSIAILLTLIWLLCFIFLNPGPSIHIILVMAFITILSKLIRDDKSV